MEETIKLLIDNIASTVAEKIAGQINTSVELKQYPENMDLNTAADYVGLNSAYMRRNLEELGIKYRRAGDKYLFRKCWLDEWMEDGVKQIQKNKDAKINMKLVKSKAM
jgi:excisionase family DNA binding protein